MVVRCEQRAGIGMPVDIFGDATLPCFFESFCKSEAHMMMGVVAVEVVFENSDLLFESGLHWGDGEPVPKQTINTTGYKERYLGECVNCGLMSDRSLNLV